MFLSDFLKQSLHALIPFGSVVLTRVRASQTKVSIGIANREIFRELSVRTKMASANWVLGGFSRPSAVRITPVAPDAAARAQNEHYRNHKARPSPHSQTLPRATIRLAGEKSDDNNRL